MSTPVMPKVRQVWRYSLERALPVGHAAYSVPFGAQFLTVEIAGDGWVSVYFLVDPNEPARELRSFHIFGTGHDVPDYVHYLGTYKQGIFVWHVFQNLERTPAS